MQIIHTTGLNDPVDTAGHVVLLRGTARLREELLGQCSGDPAVQSGCARLLTQGNFLQLVEYKALCAPVPESAPKVFLGARALAFCGGIQLLCPPRGLIDRHTRVCLE